MIVSHKHRFIFIKTRKTAGTSLEVFLSQHCGADDVVTPIQPHVEPHQPRNHEGFFNHMPGHKIREAIGDDCWRNYFRFCVERNPWDKTLSHFHFIKNYQMNGVLTFEDYLDSNTLCVDHPFYTEPGEPGCLLVNKVLRYEHLNDELAELFAHLGIPYNGSLEVQAKSEFRTDRRRYQDVLSPEQAAQISHAFQQEIHMFGYRY